MCQVSPLSQKTRLPAAATAILPRRNGGAGRPCRKQPDVRQTVGSTSRPGHSSERSVPHPSCSYTMRDLGAPTIQRGATRCAPRAGSARAPPPALFVLVFLSACGAMTAPLGSRPRRRPHRGRAAELSLASVSMRPRGPRDLVTALGSGISPARGSVGPSRRRPTSSRPCGRRTPTTGADRDLPHARHHSDRGQGLRRRRVTLAAPATRAHARDPHRPEGPGHHRLGRRRPARLGGVGSRGAPIPTDVRPHRQRARRPRRDHRDVAAALARWHWACSQEGSPMRVGLRVALAVLVRARRGESGGRSGPARAGMNREQNAPGAAGPKDSGVVQRGAQPNPAEVRPGTATATRPRRAPGELVPRPRAGSSACPSTPRSSSPACSSCWRSSPVS